MSGTIGRPARLQINAWSPDRPNADDLPARTPWAQRQQGEKPSRFLAPALLVDQRDWRHPDVGWGLVLRDNDTLSNAARATAVDAPEAIQDLLASRPGSPVLRWRPDLQRYYLRRYYADGRAQDLSVAAPVPGIQEGHIPRYLLIYGPPSEIPWAVQYALNMGAFVGRLDLHDGGLEAYVKALREDWAGQSCRPRAPLVWNVDHGSDDITWLMARAIGVALWQKFEADTDLPERLRLKGAEATGARLVEALTQRQPGLVVTTSHGVTGTTVGGPPLTNQLGLPVDANYQALRLEDIAAWKPSGAIWYSHACCSAGADSPSRHASLLPPDSPITQILTGVAKAANSVVSPLPNHLLGAERPLRAFVGHVEPTFDWTLRDPTTRQPLAHVLVGALYDRLYQQDRRTPIGFALRTVFEEAGNFFGMWDKSIDGINNTVPGQRDWALYHQLVALDRQTTVILGDPTVSLPPLG